MTASPTLTTTSQQSIKTGSRQRARRVLACYVPFADPLFDRKMLNVYDDCGVDVFEIGLPCSNPYADGEVIANSMRRAYESDPQSRRLSDIVDHVFQRQSSPKIALMAYQQYLDEVQPISSNINSKLSGLLCLPLEGKSVVEPHIWKLGDEAVKQIMFMPHELPEQLFSQAQMSSSYLMLQARPGTTGVSADVVDCSEKITKLKDLGVSVPILLGFGISSEENVKQAMAMGADGVVIGSACLKIYEEQGLSALGKFLTKIRGTLDA